jgi:hypothetical protein
MKHKILSAVMLLASSVAAAEEVTLRCEFAEDMNHERGLFVIARISEHSVVRTLHDSTGSYESTFAVTERNDTVLRAMRTTLKGQRELMLFDRVSGRLTEQHEVLERDRERLWNDEKQQVGGFDPGRELWLVNVLDCSPIKRVV